MADADRGISVDHGNSDCEAHGATNRPGCSGSDRDRNPCHDVGIDRLRNQVERQRQIIGTALGFRTKSDLWPIDFRICFCFRNRFAPLHKQMIPQNIHRTE